MLSFINSFLVPRSHLFSIVSTIFLTDTPEALVQFLLDCSVIPDPEVGWSPEKCKALGASLLDVASHLQPYLRAEGPFWATMDARDAYVPPVEGTAHSTLPARSAGNVYNEDDALLALDKKLADAESLVNSLKSQRAVIKET